MGKLHTWWRVTTSLCENAHRAPPDRRVDEQWVQPVESGAPKQANEVLNQDSQGTCTSMTTKELKAAIALYVAVFKRGPNP